MPISSTQLTGAAFPMQIHERKYSARTLTDRDHAELDGYVQNELMQVARNTLSPTMLPEERKEQLSAALVAATGISWSSLEGNKIMSKLRGVVRLGWQMIKHYHSDLSFDEFYDHFVRNEDKQRKMEEVQKAINTVDETFLILNTSYRKQDETLTDAEDEGDSAEDSKS